MHGEEGEVQLLAASFRRRHAAKSAGLSDETSIEHSSQQLARSSCQPPAKAVYWLRTLEALQQLQQQKVLPCWCSEPVAARSRGREVDPRCRSDLRQLQESLFTLSPLQKAQKFEGARWRLRPCRGPEKSRVVRRSQGQSRQPLHFSATSSARAVKGILSESQVPVLLKQA